MALSFRHRHVAPAAAALYAHGNDGIASDLHGLELSIARTQERLCTVMFLAVHQDLAMPMQHHPAEQAPVLVVTIHDQRDRGIVEEIAHALEHRAWMTLGFVIHGDIEGELFD